MPRKDGTGPMGMGAMTGQGRGFCARPAGQNDQRPVRGLGLGCRRGFGRGWNREDAVYGTAPQATRTDLQNQKEHLQQWIQNIDAQLKEE